MSRLLPLALGALALSATMLPATALAQYAHQPFFEHTVAESQALGFETIGNKLLLATKLSVPLDDDLIERLEAMSGADLARFVGTLESKDQELAASLSKALEGVADTARDGEDVGEAVKAAQDLLVKSYDAVIGQDLRNEQSFKAGLMVNLLLAEGGVAEGYEEALESHEPWAYSDGWAALQRVKQLWAELKPLGTQQRQEDGQEMIDALDTLFPSIEPPASMAEANGDDAEVPAQRLAGILEEVDSSDLYPGRDLPRLTGYLAEITAKACDAYGARKGAAAAESLYAAHDHYANSISETAGLVAPELDEKIPALFDKLIAVADDDDATTADGAGDDDDSDDDGIITDSPVATCGQLRQAFGDLQAAFGN